MNFSEIWQAVLADLELSISKANFVTWFKQTGIISFQDGQLLVCVPNMFTRSWLEKKYHQSIIKSLERITGEPIKKLDYKIDNIKNVLLQTEFVVPALPPTETAAASLSDVIKQHTPAPATNKFGLSAKYNFESYVVGKGSELACAAAQAVSNRPGEAYNPLFIYGGVGLGKTHLMQAVGNELFKRNPNINIVYVSAEKFSNDYISSVREKTTKEFQIRYRNVDLLLIDDIQFIAGKEGTQESFFHTFNELHQQNKQVIITSDRPPKAIPALEDRLKSRFEWGMIADVSAPDFETRAAILAKKCAEKKFSLPTKILETIAVTVQSNIRELEGALNKIIVFHQLKNSAPTVESVKALLSGPGGATVRQTVTPQQLIDTVRQFYNISQEEILGKNREKKISLPRQIIMFLMREEFNMSYPAIGTELGGRDHTTAMHACEKITQEIEANLKIRQEVEMLKQRLYINNV